MAGISAVLLAAGESSRMGQPKALLPWRGQTLLEWQISSLARAGVGETVVVLGHLAEQVAPYVRGIPSLRSVVNHQYRKGKTTSIKAGVSNIDPSAEGVLILAVDQPRPWEVLSQIIQAHLREGASITVPTYAGRRGHPPIFASVLFSELMAISEKTLGLRQVMADHGTEVNEVEAESAVVLLDLNSPQDYAEARKLFPAT